MHYGGKTFVYMHTDTDCERRLSIESGVMYVRDPIDAEQRNRIIDLSVKPKFVGCRHLRAMLTNSDAYGVSARLVESVMRIFLNVYYDHANPLSSHLLYVSLRNHQDKSSRYKTAFNESESSPKTSTAYVHGSHTCPGVGVLLTPGVSDEARLNVYHYQNVVDFRRMLCKFLSWMNVDLGYEALFDEIQSLAERHIPLVDAAYGNDKIFDVTFDEPPAAAEPAHELSPTPAAGPPKLHLPGGPFD